MARWPSRAIGLPHSGALDRSTDVAARRWQQIVRDPGISNNHLASSSQPIVCKKHDKSLQASKKTIPPSFNQIKPAYSIMKRALLTMLGAFVIGAKIRDRRGSPARADLYKTDPIM
jgi:hypothetical protein